MVNICIRHLLLCMLLCLACAPPTSIFTGPAARQVFLLSLHTEHHDGNPSIVLSLSTDSLIIKLVQNQDVVDVSKELQFCIKK